ncbi:unnamed protein product, partial [Effrenium voratum]
CLSLAFVIFAMRRNYLRKELPCALLILALFTQGICGFCSLPNVSRRDLLRVSLPLVVPLPAAAAQPQAKRQLLALADTTARGTAASAEQKRQMSQLADDLAASAPAATKSMMSGTWNLVYTTEKEVLSLIGDPDISVYQKLDADAGTLGNSIVYSDGRRFDVAGRVEVAGQRSAGDEKAPPGLRSDFSFTGATLQLAPGVALPLPPFGAGWFVSTYLDDTLRVNRDSRGDLAIYVRA